MERAGQTEIFRHNRTPLGVVSRFLLQAAQTEMDVPFQNINISIEFAIFLPSSAIT